MKNIGLISEINVGVNTIKYILLSILCTMLVVWEKKQWYWSLLIEVVGLSDKTIIVTHLLEELYTYLTMTVYIGLLIGSISISLLIIQYVRKGLYVYEEKRLIRRIIGIGVVNIIIIGWIESKVMNMLIATTDMALLAKMSEALGLIIKIQMMGQLIWVIPVIMSRSEEMRRRYRENRGQWALLVGVIVGLVTPPDLIITTITTGWVVGIVEMTEIASLVGARSLQPNSITTSRTQGGNIGKRQRG